MYNIGHHDTECTNLMVLNCAKDLRHFKFGMILMTHKIMNSWQSDKNDGIVDKRSFLTVMQWKFHPTPNLARRWNLGLHWYYNTQIVISTFPLQSSIPIYITSWILDDTIHLWKTHLGGSWSWLYIYIVSICSWSIYVQNPRSFHVEYLLLNGTTHEIHDLESKVVCRAYHFVIKMRKTYKKEIWQDEQNHHP